MVDIDISVIIPVRDAAGTLPDCIRAARVALKGLSAEVIVVGDRIADDSLEIARKFGCIVMALDGKTGPAAARNLGAATAAGDVLAFVDADVVVPPDAFQKVLGRIRDGGWDGLFGVVSPRFLYGPFAGRLKNLWMHYSYGSLPEEAPLFLTCFAAVRRDKFYEAGGFDEGYAGASVEDTDFGHRLADAGVRIYCDVGLEVDHRKEMTGREVLRTDFNRAAALARLTLRERRQGRAGRHALSIPLTHYFSVMAVCLAAALLLPGVILLDAGFLLSSLICLAAGVAALLPFLSYLRKHADGRFAARAAAFMIPDHFAVAAGVVKGIYDFRKGKRF